MTIEVDYDEKTHQVHISWDKNDPVESQLNHWTETDFLECLRSALTQS